MTSLAEYALASSLLPIVTVFSIEHVPAMQSLPWAAYKIASPDIINRPLIDAVQTCGKPTILSTGAAMPEEIIKAASWFRSDDFALMQCVSAYPTPDDSAHLGAIATLQALADVPVGYSDHTIHEQTGGLAVAAGAALLEKHITIDRSATGPDHAMSLDPASFKRYVQFARLAAGMLGESRKIVHDIERDVRQVSRQSIVTTQSLSAGHLIQREDVTIKRPGGGLAPARLRELIGQRIRADVQADTMLTEAHVETKPAANCRGPRIDAAAQAA
jgi:sialic acid synthase SpsE